MPHLNCIPLEKSSHENPATRPRHRMERPLRSCCQLSRQELLPALDQWTGQAGNQELQTLVRSETRTKRATRYQRCG